MSCFGHKKDTFTKLVNIVLPEKACDTGNLRKDLNLTVGARVMITTNIDVSDGLTNGAMGFVTNLIPDQKTGHIVVVLVMFDHESIGQDAKREAYINMLTKILFLFYKYKFLFQLKVNLFRQQGHSFH